MEPFPCHAEPRNRAAMSSGEADIALAQQRTRSSEEVNLSIRTARSSPCADAIGLTLASAWVFMAPFCCFVQAMNTGHDGSLATLHANSAVDALARLASLVVRAAPGWPLADVERQVARSIDAVVHVARSDRAGRTEREVVQVVEVDPDTAAVHLLVDRDAVHRPLVRRRAGASR